MRKILPLLILIWSSVSLRAQISVASFTLLDSDPDARIHAVLDEEDIPGALLKIVTTAKGFNYDIGQLPVINVDENHVGEIWVYVPEGTLKMKISHPDLGSLSGADIENGYFMFPQRLKHAKVYRMELTHQEVTKTVGPQIPVSLTFNCDVNGAEVIIGAETNAISAGNISNNHLTIYPSKGQTINYRIKKDRYEDYVGTYKVENDENKIDIKLKPLFGNVTITTLPDASIYLNGNYVGKGSYNDNLDLGNYTVKISREGYRDEIRNFNVVSGDRKTIEISPNMIFGSLDVTTTPSGADVYIDGKYMGKTPYKLNQLMVGTHSLEVKKSGYEDWSKSIKIEEGKTDYENVKLSDYGRITINSSVPKSSVYVNDRYMGTTPYNLSGPAGKYKIKIENGPQFSVYKRTINLNAESKNIFVNNYKRIFKRNGVYFTLDAGYSPNAFYNIPIAFGLGTYLYNFNLEFNLIIPAKGKENDLPEGARTGDYLTKQYEFLVGYALNLNRRFRLTPQIGMELLNASNFTGGWPNAIVENKSKGIGLPLKLKLDYAVTKWFFVFLRPSYMLSFKDLGTISKQNVSMFNIAVGINFFIGWGN